MAVKVPADQGYVPDLDGLTAKASCAQRMQHDGNGDSAGGGRGGGG